MSLIADPITLDTANAVSDARRNGRGDNSSETAVGCIGQVVSWPYATDSNGQTYPSGLLGVSIGAADLYNQGVTAFNTGLIAVPDTLPAGWTPRAVQEHCRGIGLGMLKGQMCPFSYTGSTGGYYVGWETDGTTSPQAPRIAGESTLYPYIFWPENLGSAAFHFNDVNGWGPTGKSMGLRYFRSRVVYTGIFDPVYYDYGQFQIVRSLTPASAIPLDPVTGLWTDADATVWTSPHITADYDSGYLFDVTDADFKAPAGTRAYFSSRFTLHTAATNPADPPNTWRRPTFDLISASEHWWGPRLDIPLPFPVFGENNTVAPGGVYPGILPGY